MTASRPTFAQRLITALLLVYCGATVALGLPEEVVPAAMHERTSQIRGTLDRYGINPWHFVFPGRRDHQKRRHIATRYTGITVDGKKVVLHEGPRGLTNPSVRLFDSVRDTASHKILSMLHGGRLMRYRDDEVWAEGYRKFVETGRAQYMLMTFCLSRTLNGDRDLASVEMELFVAGIDYHTGEQYGRALKVGRLHCKTRVFSASHGAPEVRPDWPGVQWRTVR